MSQFSHGDYVQVNDCADNFVGAFGRVVKVGEVTCEVEVDGYTGSFLFEHLQRIGLKLVLEQTYKTVDNALTMPWELHQVAKDLEAEGYQVRRGIVGSVVLSMPDGEIHFIPSGNQIVEYVLQTTAKANQS